MTGATTGPPRPPERRPVTPATPRLNPNSPAKMAANAQVSSECMGPSHETSVIQATAVGGTMTRTRHPRRRSRELGEGATTSYEGSSRANPTEIAIKIVVICAKIKTPTPGRTATTMTDSPDAIAGAHHTIARAVYRYWPMRLKTGKWNPSTPG